MERDHIGKASIPGLIGIFKVLKMEGLPHENCLLARHDVLSDVTTQSPQDGLKIEVEALPLTIGERTTEGRAHWPKMWIAL